MDASTFELSDIYIVLGCVANPRLSPFPLGFPLPLEIYSEPFSGRTLVIIRSHFADLSSYDDLARWYIFGTLAWNRPIETLGQR